MKSRVTRTDERYSGKQMPNEISVFLWLCVERGAGAHTVRQRNRALLVHRFRFLFYVRWSQHRVPQNTYRKEFAEIIFRFYCIVPRIVRSQSVPYCVLTLILMCESAIWSWRFRLVGNNDRKRCLRFNLNKWTVVSLPSWLRLARSRPLSLSPQPISRSVLKMSHFKARGTQAAVGRQNNEIQLVEKIQFLALPRFLPQITSSSANLSIRGWMSLVNPTIARISSFDFSPRLVIQVVKLAKWRSNVEHSQRNRCDEVCVPQTRDDTTLWIVFAISVVVDFREYTTVPKPFHYSTKSLA